jgi:hypothetical protein
MLKLFFDAKHLISILGSLALVVDLAGAYIHNHGLTILEYISVIASPIPSDAEIQLLDWTPSELFVYGKGLLATFRTTVRTFENTPALKNFQLFSFLDGSAIHEGILESAVNPCSEP